MRSATFGLLLLALGCTDELPPEGQILLYVNTDAPLPPGETALFDRLRIDIFPPGATETCVGCSREFGIDAPTIDEGRASVGIAPPFGVQGYRARARLYRSGGTSSGEPRLASTIESVVALPATEPEGIIEVTVMLRTDDVARQLGTLDDPIEPQFGPPRTGIVGTWPGARRVDCPAPPRDDEVCVPGGAFWMGDPRLDLSAAFDLDGELERLVVLSPFYLDREEVDVAAFRASGLAEYLVPGAPSDDPHEAGQNIPFCTFTSLPGSFEAHPVNCVTWHRSQLFCEQAGKLLPTEAQLERVLSGLGRTPFVWGTDQPRCEDAVFERDEECSHLGTGPAPSGTGLRDRLSLAGGEIVDLAGNVLEWAADSWNRQEEPCWGTGVFFDPRCDLVSPSDGAARSFRGDDWQSSIEPAAVRSYQAFEMNAVSARLGFRCARPAE